MGVPALFRWLSAKYPKIVERVQEAPTIDEDGTSIPVDLSDPNPNGVEFDNLYLDMNGIIHPCCHPMDKPAPNTEEEMMLEIFKYIDRIFAMIRPRRLLFMAIDGVAPRAKMNQQRSRRFRAAKERREKAAREAELASTANSNGKDAENGDAEAEDDNGDEAETVEGTSAAAFDYNCITPGTKFMALIATSIQYYIVERMNKERAWKNIKVIFSDANVPGEGEHKIVDYIRRQRLDPDYDPNTKHVIYGLDADLIMLSMATHEPYFRVLREDVFWEEQIKYNPCTWCGTKGHTSDFCAARAEADSSFKIPPVGEGKPFIFLDVAVLREYLDAELRPSDTSLPFKYDLERAIDDWIFMCFFVGNDFLPHLPSLEIREGAIDLLIESYKANAARMGGYICSHGKVNLSRAQLILADLGAIEEKIFLKRKEKEDRRDANIRRRRQTDAERDAITQAQKDLLLPAAPVVVEIKTAKELARDADTDAQTNIVKQRREANIAAAQQLKTQLGAVLKGDKGDDAASTDDVRLWEPGFKERYYMSKFHLDPKQRPEELCNIARSYLEGLCWVMGYYYQGCPSWKWFYPYHFAPFASDLLASIDDGIGDFELGVPFRPFDQLMGVFPADSRELVPAPFRPLMTEADSEIIDFYPEDFAIDLNGKKHAWQGVVLLPFIEEDRLLMALNKVYPQLSPEELRLNERGEDLVFFSATHLAVPSLLEALDDDLHLAPLNPLLTGGLAGYIRRNPAFPAPGQTYVSPLPAWGCHNLLNVSVVSFTYFVPYHERTQLRHKAILLPEAKLPPPILSAEEVAGIRSGAASKRVPGRLLFDYRPNSGPGGLSGGPPRYGHHSMHQEYGREYERGSNYRGGDRRDRDHYERERSPDRRAYGGRHYSQSDRSERRYQQEPSNKNRYSSYQPPLAAANVPAPSNLAMSMSNNPFGVLAGAAHGYYPPPPPPPLTRPPPFSSLRHGGSGPMQPVLNAFHRPPPGPYPTSLPGQGVGTGVSPGSGLYPPPGSGTISDYPPQQFQQNMDNLYGGGSTRYPPPPPRHH